MCSKILSSLLTIALTLNAAYADAPVPQYGPPGFGGGAGRPAPSYGPPNGGFGGGNGGGGYGSAEEGGKPEPFNFEYEVKDAESGNDFGHRASSDGTKVTGTYHVLLPDGRNQIVDYTADDNGYNANVKYEGEANTGSGNGGFQGGRPGGAGGYPSGPGGAGGYPSGGPSGGYPSPAGSGYPAAGPPGSSYLPPRK